MKLQDLQTEYNRYLDINKDMITDLVDNGINLLYGESGVGKTYSMIKHLNQNNIKPILVDFDNNKKIDDLDYYQIDGEFFVENYDELILNKMQRLKLDQAIENIKSSIKSFYSGKPIPSDFTKVTSCYDFDELYYFAIRNKIYDDIKLENLKAYKKEYDDLIKDQQIQNEVIIIDTYKMALFYFDDDMIKLKEFLDKLLSKRNTIILIAHTNGTVAGSIDMDLIFANHCDSKLKLARSQTKTKGADYTLFIEKLRGYKGKTVIENWMR